MLRVKVPHGRRHARAARDVRATSPRRTRAAGVTSRPARTCSSTSSSSSRRPRSCACSRRSASRRARRAATPCATSWAATSPARARKRCSTSRRGPRPPPTSCCATPTRSGCRASSRSTSPAARPTAARRCSTTSASSPPRARSPTAPTEAGFQVFVAGGLGANPHPAQALEDFTAREDLLPTIYACLRTFDHYGNRDNKIRARMKWLVDTMGIDELRERILKERKFLRARARLAGRHPRAGARARRRARRRHARRDQGRHRRGVPVKLLSSDPYERWDEANVVRGIDQAARSARWRTPASATSPTEQFRAPRRHPARLQPRRPHHEPPELRAARPAPRPTCARSTTG